ncbi:transketolase [Isoptericola sp. b441]|uniref:Transketolase n=1 Tax=Actinotalea lenta TaxID=3064654 RepID=A0ABT9DBW5_9CELL|nr:MULTISPECIES: transketolase [unclassified Isoptericola]MDO8108374.1 transketolase [Isoptericola sp. b441]MDO8119792.1 transketolase [Isoptericola sp. b490]
MAPRLPASFDDAEIAALEETARQVRISVIEAINVAKAGHLGGPLSAADILTALYFKVLRIRPDEPTWPDRDRFVLSKGHSAIGLYATMAHRGYLPVDELLTFDAVHSRLQGHPEMTRLPGIDMSTGSLGMGISAAMGMALGARLQRKDFLAFAMLGDGECQEGEVWEAAMAAARHRLDNLVVIVDENHLQQFGWLVDRDGPTRLVKPPHTPGQLADKWRAFGWRVLDMDGHDMRDILATLRQAIEQTDSRPTAIIAQTVKGKGVSYMEDDYTWHSKPLSPEDYATALADLGAGTEAVRQ